MMADWPNISTDVRNSLRVTEKSTLTSGLPRMSRNGLPSEVARLYPREREVAEIVFSAGFVTAKDVQARLSDPLTSAAVRSMLNRLVRKGILARRAKEFGPEYIYYAAINNIISRERALKQLAEDFFGGSLQEAAVAVVNLSRRAAQHRQEAP